MYVTKYLTVVFQSLFSAIDGFLADVLFGGLLYNATPVGNTQHTSVVCDPLATLNSFVINDLHDMCAV